MKGMLFQHSTRRDLLSGRIVVQRQLRSRSRFNFGVMVRAAALALWFVFSLFPFYWIGLMSFKTPVDVIAIPPKFVFRPTLENFAAVFGSQVSDPGAALARTDFVKYFTNSIVVSSGAIALSLIIGLPAAYGVARFRFRGRESLAFTFLSFRFAPELAIILPLYVLFRRYGLYDTYWGLVLAYQVVTLPLMIWLMRGYFEELPREVEESALVDGATHLSVFTRIALPLAKPGLAASTVLCFIFAWNNFILGLILGAQRTQPVTVGLLGFISYEQVRRGPMAAATLVAILPVLILAASIQRYLVRGLTFGSLKG